jgi:Fic family protein
MSDRDRIGATGRIAGSALRVHQAMQERPITSAPAIIEATGLTSPTVHTCLRSLESLGIVTELTGRKRGRLYSYAAYLAILSEGTEGPPG